MYKVGMIIEYRMYPRSHTPMYGYITAVSFNMNIIKVSWVDKVFPVIHNAYFLNSTCQIVTDILTYE